MEDEYFAQMEDVAQIADLRSELTKAQERIDILETDPKELRRRRSNILIRMGEELETERATLAETKRELQQITDMLAPYWIGVVDVPDLSKRIESVVRALYQAKQKAERELSDLKARLESGVEVELEGFFDVSLRYSRLQGAWISGAPDWYAYLQSGEKKRVLIVEAPCEDQ